MQVRKWHCYLADLNPRFGTEPGKLRPVIVIQTNLLNETAHPSTLICPLTTKVFPKTKWLRVHLEKNEAGLDEKSDILVDQIRAIDNRRFKKVVGKLAARRREKLLENLQILVLE